MPPPEAPVEQVHSEDVETPPRKSRLGLLLFGFFGSVLAVLSLLYAYYEFETNRIPQNFPAPSSFVITEGSSASRVTEELAAQNFVRSEFMLFLELMLAHDPSTIKAGTYTLDRPLSIAEIATLITEGDFAADLLRFTHFEGERVELLAAEAAATFPNFDTAAFLTLALPEEGKLFPETYLVPKDYTATELYTLLRTTFDDRVLPVLANRESSTLTIDEIVILASIIEREANSPESMKLVSGILQNRLKIGMALQVDASMEYVLEKPLKELTPEDLERDTPYNTYLYPGLPPTPIGNPGLEAIAAVLEPTPSPYLFYITGSDGEFYYAETFDEHRVNIARYLR